MCRVSYSTAFAERTFQSAFDSSVANSCFLFPRTALPSMAGTSTGSSGTAAGATRRSRCCPAQPWRASPRTAGIGNHRSTAHVLGPTGRCAMHRHRPAQLHTCCRTARASSKNHGLLQGTLRYLRVPYGSFKGSRKGSFKDSLKGSSTGSLQGSFKGSLMSSFPNELGSDVEGFQW